MRRYETEETKNEDLNSEYESKIMRRAEELTEVQQRVVVPFEVRTELKSTLDNLKSILNDNLNFLSKILYNCMLIGKTHGASGVFFSDIEHMIRSEYPDVVRSEDGHKLLQNVGSLVNQICLNSKLIKSLVKNKPFEAQLEIRNLLEQDITHFLDYEVQSIYDIPLIGDIIQ